MNEPIKTISEMTDEEVKEHFEGHKCTQETCAICFEYMERFDPERLANLLMSEVSGMDDILMMQPEGVVL